MYYEHCVWLTSFIVCVLFCFYFSFEYNNNPDVSIVIEAASL